MIKHRSARFAFRLDMIRHEPVAEFRHGGRTALTRPFTRRIATVGDFSKNSLRLSSSGFWRDLTDRSDRVPPNRSTTTGARPVHDDVGHGAGRPDADTKAGQLRVQDCVFGRPGFQSVYNSLRNALTHVVA